MIRVRGLKFPDEDAAYEYFEQRKLDDADRNLDAFILGRQAGLLCLPAGVNPYPMGSDEAAEWNRGRLAVEALRAAEALKQRARTLCQPCTCGGRGLCRDAA